MENEKVKYGLDTAINIRIIFALNTKILLNSIHAQIVRIAVSIALFTYSFRIETSINPWL